MRVILTFHNLKVLKNLKIYGGAEEDMEAHE